MKISDIKGIYAQNLLVITNHTITNIFNKIIKDEFNKLIHFNRPVMLHTITLLKCMFGKNGVSTNFSNNYNSYPKNYMSHSYIEVDTETFEKLNLFDFKSSKFEKTYIKTFSGITDFIDYHIQFNFQYSEMNSKYYCCVDYSFHGDLEKSLIFCPIPGKRYNYNFKDMNGDKISKNDEILWIDVNYHTRKGRFVHSIVSDFDEGIIISSTNNRIHAHEGHKNDHIVIVNKKMKFAGILIN